MKRNLIVLFLLSLALSLTALCQTGAMPPGHQMLADPEKFAQGHLSALDQQLHLSADQKTQLHSVFLSEGKQLFALLNNSGMSTEQKQIAIEKLHTDTVNKVDAILTPEQRRQFSPPTQGPSPSHVSQT